MRLNIAPKLFFGFLVVIFLNVFFFVIISKIETVNSITHILKNQHDIKNHLLRLKTLHRVQGPSIISFERLGRTESAENFREIHGEIVVLLDTIAIKLNHNLYLDSIIMQSSRLMEPVTQAYQTTYQLRTKYDSIVIFNDLYLNSFNSIVENRNTNGPKEEQKTYSDVLKDAANKISLLLDSSEVYIDDLTDIRLGEVEFHVSNIKKLTLLIIAGVTLFAILFGFIFSKYITNSLRRLKDAASTIGSGVFDFNPHGYPSDEIGDLASAFFDMSIDLKNKEEELIKLQRMAAIGEVIASVNHEINNPLMIISGNAQFLEMIMEGYPIELKERVKTILEETERISMVTRKLREIKNPVVEDYTSSGEQMINLDKSSLDL